MKILHTSDWHLGRSFHGADLLDEQAEALDRIASIVEAEQVELVIVAGDLYDRAIPPAPAVRLLGDTLERFVAAGAAVAAISGNHDSPVRIGGNDALLNRMGVALRGDHRRVDEPLVLDRPRDGGPPVAVYLIPYLEPAAVAADLLPGGVPAEEADPAATAPDGDAEPNLLDLIESEPATGRRRGRRATQDLVTRAAVEAARAHHAELDGARSVVVAHTFVAGGEVSESERDLSVGNVERVAVSTFEGFDLVALGHLHSPQRLDGDRVAYSGTPLPYSFSEEGQQKSVRLVELHPDGRVEATAVPLEAGRPVRTITGELADLLRDPGLEDAVDARVRVILEDRHLPDQAMPRIRSRFPHAVELRHRPAGVGASDDDGFVGAGDLRRLDPLELARRFWEEQVGSPATDEEHDLLRDALTATMGEAR